MRIKGTARADTIWGSDIFDYILGGRGDDILDGQGGTDRINGEWGNDTIFGGSSWDLYGQGDGYGEEFLYGGRGNDRIFDGDGVGEYNNGVAKGGPGNDHLHINGGEMQGNAGNDLLAGSGWCQMSGGSGADTFVPVVNEILSGYGKATEIQDFKPGVDKMGLRVELADGTILFTQDVFNILDTNYDGVLGNGGDAETWLGHADGTAPQLQITLLNDLIYITGAFALRAEDMALI